MAIQNMLEDVTLVTLPKEPQSSGELEKLNEIASNKCDSDVVIDCSKVKILTSAAICNLMILTKLLSGLGHQLVLCNVSPPVKRVFMLTGLEASFHFADDVTAALEAIQRAKAQTP